MTTTFSVFCIGSNHAAHEPNSTVGNLGLSCAGPKVVIDGVGASEGSRIKNLLGNTRGWGMDDRVRTVVDRIAQARPQVVNMVGHSRGAVICHMVANELADHAAAGSIREINIFAIDPVNMSVHSKRGRHLRQNVKLGDYVGLIMENVTGLVAGTMFPTATLRKLDVQLREKLIYYNLPGTHGSGTQPFTSVIGLCSHGMAKRFMTLWGTDFRDPPPTAGQMCNAFSAIVLENPVEFAANGKAKRLFSNDAKGMTTDADKVAWNKSATGAGARRSAALKKYWSRMRTDPAGLGHDYRGSMFFNEYHADCFRQAFPAIYNGLATGAIDEAATDRELTALRLNYPNVNFHLENLGVI